MAAGAAGCAASATYLLTLANSSGISTNPSTSQISFTRAGGISIAATITTPSASYDWISPKFSTVGDAWEIKVDITSGTFSTGTTGTWLPLSSTQTWAKNAIGTVNANVSIGRVGTSTALITKTLLLEVD